MLPMAYSQDYLDLSSKIFCRATRKFRYSLRRASSRVQRGSALWRGLLRLLTAMVSGGTPRLEFPALAWVFTPKRRIFSVALLSAVNVWSSEIAWIVWRR